MESYTLSLKDLLWLTAALCTLAAAWKILKNNPLARHEQRLDGHDQKLAKDYAKLQEAEETNRIMCKCLLALIDHEITGNGIDRMKQIKSELQQYLIDK